MKQPKHFLIIATHNGGNKGIVEANRKSLTKWIENFVEGKNDGDAFRKIEIFAKTPDGIYVPFDECSHARVGF